MVTDDMQDLNAIEKKFGKKKYDDGSMMMCTMSVVTVVRSSSQSAS